ncbi:MAG: protein-export chaperone SecB [Bauldia sp.]
MADVSDNGGAGQPAGPSLSIIAQYLKDISFENPDAPNSLRPRERPPTINIGINVQANPLSQSDIEVELKIEGRASDGDKTIFVVELAYAGVFRFMNVPQEQIHPLLMIECPRLLFPFARHIIADATREGGFPPLMVDPVDFAALYRQRLGAGGGAGQGIRPS